MKRKMLLLVLLVLPFAVSAQSRQYSNDGRRDQQFCLDFSDSTSLVVALAKAGANDAQIQARMRSLGMMPLDAKTRRAAEQNARYVEVNEVLSTSYVDCMRLMGRTP